MELSEKLEIAAGLIDSGKYKQAKNYLNDIIDEFPNEAEAFILRGFAFFSTAEIEKAINDLNYAIEIKKEADVAYWYLSQIYLHRTEYDKAKEYILEARKIDHHNFNYIGDLAVIEQLLKNFQKSIELCNIILSEYPADNFALNTRGYNYLSLGNYQKAISDFEKALLDFPKDALTLNNLGYSFLKIGEYNKAKHNFKAAIQLDPDFAYPYNNLGYIYFIEKNNSRALDFINQSIELDPSNSMAYKDRAMVNLALNNNKEAKSDLFKARELGYAEEFDSEVDELIRKLDQG